MASLQPIPPSPRRKGRRARADRSIYFAQGAAIPLIKIGWAFDPAQRLAELQVGSPDRLAILDTIPATPYTESLLHTLFAPYRRHGEWFRPAREILSFLSDCASARAGKLQLGHPWGDQAVHELISRYVHRHDDFHRLLTATCVLVRPQLRRQLRAIFRPLTEEPLAEAGINLQGLRQCPEFRALFPNEQPSRQPDAPRPS